MKSLSRFVFLGFFTLSVTLLFGCKDKEQKEQKIPEVAYIVVQPEEISVINELSGRLESYRNSDVRARVAGVLEKRLFEEGSDVNKGDKLFIIDPRSYEASVQNARAALARAEANFMQADLKYKRYIPLVKISAVSKQEYDDAYAAQKQAAADVASAKAALINAKLDLEYSTVLAPISGRIGRSMVTEGALVGQGEVTLLAVIQQIDPIYLNLTQSSAELLQLQQAMKQGLLKNASEEGLKVALIMEDGTAYSHTGKLLFSDITVDPSTGEISIRALFPNPEGILLPGMYVRGQMEQAINENAITIPKQAVQRSTEGSTVFVINKDNIAETRSIKTGASYKENWVVLDGLKAGDRVAVEGIQKIRPGNPVMPVAWEKEITPAVLPSQNTEKSDEKDLAAKNLSADQSNNETASPEKTETKPSQEEPREINKTENKEVNENPHPMDKTPLSESGKPSEKSIKPIENPAKPIELPIKPIEKNATTSEKTNKTPITKPVTESASQEKSTEIQKSVPEKKAALTKNTTKPTIETAKPTEALRQIPANNNLASEKKEPSDNIQTDQTPVSSVEIKKE